MFKFKVKGIFVRIDKNCYLNNLVYNAINVIVLHVFHNVLYLANFFSPWNLFGSILSLNIQSEGGCVIRPCFKINVFNFSTEEQIFPILYSSM